MKFGEMLRGQRESKGLSRRALSEASGVSFAAIRTYEDGDRSPSFTNVVKLAAALGLTCQDFAGCEDVADPAADPPPAKKPSAGKSARTRRKG